MKTLNKEGFTVNHKQITYTLLCLSVLFVLAGCSSLTSIIQTNHSVSLGNITGHYKSGVSEGNVKKVILYIREAAILKDGQTLDFTLEKQPDEYRVVIDLEEIEKLDLEESPAAMMLGLFGSSDNSALSKNQLQGFLFRSLAIGLTEDILYEYTEIRVRDNKQRQYQIFPPSLQ